MHRSRAARYTLWGETKSLSEWREDPRAEEISQGTLRSRLNTGWGLEKALTTPVRAYSESMNIEVFGEYKSLLAWSRDERCMVPHGTLHDRFAVKGWALLDAIVTPAREIPPRTLGGQGDSLPSAAVS